MNALPLVQTTDRNVNQLQQNIKQVIGPIISNPITSGALLTDISIVSGTNVINHGLGRMMQGWIISDVNSVVTLFRSQPLNDKTLTLTSNGTSTISLYVF